MAHEEISTIASLRNIYGSPPATSLALRCMLPSLHRHHCAFIALSPFLVIASADGDGAPDISPRGDMPGFVAVADPHTLVIPDRPGNKKLVTFNNILSNPAVAVIFFIPGRTESLRVNGKGRLTADQSVLAPLAVAGKAPQSALVVTVELAFFHCGKALIRSRLWEAETHPPADVLPSLGQMFADQIAGVEVADAEARLERSISMLWSEAVSPSPTR